MSLRGKRSNLAFLGKIAAHLTGARNDPLGKAIVLRNRDLDPGFFGVDKLYSAGIVNPTAYPMNWLRRSESRKRFLERFGKRGLDSCDGGKK